MGQIVGVRRLSGMHEGKLRRHGLTHDNRALFLKPSHDPGIAKGDASGVEGATVFRRDPGGVDDVLDPNGQTVQSAQRPASAPVGIQSPGLCASEFGIEPRPGPDLRLPLCDAGDVAFY
jgi:hypothetical protein